MTRHGRHRWWPLRSRAGRDEFRTTVYATGSQHRMTLRDHLLVRYRLWRGRRAWRKRLRKQELPRFYRKARPDDVQGLVISGRSWTVGDFLPVGFEAYVRLPNPFWKIATADTEGAISLNATDAHEEDIWAIPLRCSEVAEANGLRMTPESAWATICGPSDGHQAGSPSQAWSWAPHECSIEPFVADRLFQMLRSETGPRDRCLCGQWEGGSNGWETDLMLITRGWNHFVWAARFRDVAEWLRRPYSSVRDLHVPHIVWPADRRWSLATLYSGFSNYLGGSRALIDTVLASELEAYEVALTHEAH